MPRVVLIEDNADVRELLQEALEAAGFDVFAAADGSAGIDVQIASSAEVVVTDLFMPVMEGLETIVELRRLAPQAKIVAMSAGSRALPVRADHLVTAREIGADAVLKKPFRADELIGLLRRLLG